MLADLAYSSPFRLSRPVYSDTSDSFVLNLEIRGKKLKSKSGSESVSFKIPRASPHCEAATQEVPLPGSGCSVSISYIASGPSLLASLLDESESASHASAFAEIQRMTTATHRHLLSTYFKDLQLPLALIKLTSSACSKRAKHQSSELARMLGDTWTHLFEAANLAILERVQTELPSQLFAAIAPSKKSPFKGDLALKTQLLTALAQVAVVRSGAVVLPSACELLVRLIDKLVDADTDDHEAKLRAAFTNTVMRLVIAFDLRLRPWLYEQGHVIEQVIKILQSSDSLDPSVVAQSLEIVKFFGAEYAERLETANLPSLIHHVSSTATNQGLVTVCRNTMQQMWPNSEHTSGLWMSTLSEYKQPMDERYRSRMAVSIVDTIKYKLKSESEKLKAVLQLLVPDELAFSPQNAQLFSEVYGLLDPTYDLLIAHQFFQTLVYAISTPSCPMNIAKQLMSTWFSKRPSAWSNLRSRTTRTTPNTIAPCFIDGFNSTKEADNRSNLSATELELLEKEESILLEIDFFGALLRRFFDLLNIIPLPSILSMIWHQPPLFKAVLQKYPSFLYDILKVIPFDVANLVILQALLIEVHTKDDYSLDESTALAVELTDTQIPLCKYYCAYPSLLTMPHIAEPLSLGQKLFRSSDQLPSLAIDLPIAMAAYSALSQAKTIWRRIDDAKDVPEAESTPETKKLKSDLESQLTGYLKHAQYFVSLSLSLSATLSYQMTQAVTYAALLNDDLDVPHFGPIFNLLIDTNWKYESNLIVHVVIDPLEYPPIPATKVMVGCGLNRQAAGVVLRNLLTFWAYTLEQKKCDLTLFQNYTVALKWLETQVFGPNLGWACRRQIMTLALLYLKHNIGLPAVLSKLFYSTPPRRPKQKQSVIQTSASNTTADAQESTTDKNSASESVNSNTGADETSFEAQFGELDSTDEENSFTQPHISYYLIVEALRHLSTQPPHTETMKTRFRILRSVIEEMPKLRFWFLIHSRPNHFCDPTWAREYTALAEALQVWDDEKIENNWTSLQPLLDAYYIPHLLESLPGIDSIYMILSALLPNYTHVVLSTALLVPKTGPTANEFSHLNTNLLRYFVEHVLDILIMLPVYASGPTMLVNQIQKWADIFLQCPDEPIINRTCWYMLRYSVANTAAEQAGKASTRTTQFAEDMQRCIYQCLPNVLAYPTAFATYAKFLTTQFRHNARLGPTSMTPSLPLPELLTGNLTNAFWYLYRNMASLLSCDTMLEYAHWFEELMIPARRVSAEAKFIRSDGTNLNGALKPFMHVHLPEKDGEEADKSSLKRDWIDSQRPNLMPLDSIFDNLNHKNLKDGLYGAYQALEGTKMIYGKGGFILGFESYLIISEHQVFDQLPSERRSLNLRDKTLLEMMDSASILSKELHPIETANSQILASARTSLDSIGLSELSCTVSYKNHLLNWIHTDYEDGEDEARYNQALEDCKPLKETQEQFKLAAREQLAEKRATIQQRKKQKKEEKSRAKRTLVSFNLPTNESEEATSSEVESIASFSGSDESIGSETSTYTGSSIISSDLEESLPHAVTLGLPYDLDHVWLLKESTFRQLFSAMEALLEAGSYALLYNLDEAVVANATASSMDCTLTSIEFQSSSICHLDPWLAIAPLLVGIPRLDMNTFEVFDPAAYRLQEVIPTTFYWKWLKLMAVFGTKLPRLYRTFCHHLTLKLMQKDIAESTNIHRELKTVVFMVVAEFGFASCNPQINAHAPRLFEASIHDSSLSSTSISAATSASAPVSDSKSPSSASSSSGYGLILDPCVKHRSSNDAVRERTTELRKAEKKVDEADIKPSSLFFFNDLESVPSYVVHYLPLLLDAIAEVRVRDPLTYVELLRLVPKFVTPRCVSQLFELAQFGLDQHNLCLPHLRDPISPFDFEAVAADFGRLISAVILNSEHLTRFLMLKTLVSRPLVVTKHVRVQSLSGTWGALEVKEEEEEHIDGATFICGTNHLWTFASFLRVASEHTLTWFFESHVKRRLSALSGLLAPPPSDPPSRTRTARNVAMQAYVDKMDNRAQMTLLPVLTSLLTTYHAKTLLIQNLSDSDLALRYPTSGSEVFVSKRPFYLAHPTSFEGWDQMPAVIVSTVMSHPSANAPVSMWYLSGHFGARLGVNRAIQWSGEAEEAEWHHNVKEDFCPATCSAVARLKTLDRLLRLESTFVQEKLGADEYPKKWYPKGEIVVHESPSTLSDAASGCKPKSKEKTSLHSLLSDFSEFDHDPDLKAALQASMMPTTPDPSAEASPTDSSADMPTNTVTCLARELGSSQFDIVIIAMASHLAHQPEIFQAEFEKAKGFTDYLRLKTWVQRTLNLFVNRTVPHWTKFFDLFKLALPNITLGPPSKITTNGPMWHFKHPLSWQNGHHQMSIMTRGAPSITVKIQVPVVDRVITAWWAEDAVTLGSKTTSGASKLKSENVAEDLPSSPKKSKKKNKEKKAKEKRMEDEEEEPAKEVQTKKKFSRFEHGPIEQLNLWISDTINDQANTSGLVPCIRIGYATKEALERLKDEPLNGIGDFPGSWAVDSMTGIVYSEGAIQATDLSNRKGLLPRPFANVHLIRLSFDAYNNEFCVDGVIPGPRVLHGFAWPKNSSEMSVKVRLPFSDEIGVSLFPCISFYKDVSFAVFPHSSTIGNMKA